MENNYLKFHYVGTMGIGTIHTLSKRSQRFVLDFIPPRYHLFWLNKIIQSASEFNKADLTLRDIAENGLKDDLLSCTALIDIRAELDQVTEYV